MSNSLKIAVPLLLLAAALGGAAYYLTQENPTPAPAPVQANHEPTKKPDAPPTNEPPPAPATAQAGPQEPTRTAVVANNAASDAPQGVRGRVLLPDGRAGANIPVMLVENYVNDTIRVFLSSRLQKSTAAAAVATGTTGADGTFALGIRQVGKAYDLRIVSPDHPERNLAQLKVRESDWYDAGDIRLEQGLVVQGYVFEEDTQRGIPNATVYLTNNSMALAAIATPGREKGVASVTDEKGFFRFPAAPTQGLINLTPEAEGYAGSPIMNQQLKPQGLNEFRIPMVRGQPISGVVIDPNGNPVPGATVTANGLSSKTPQNATTVSETNGAFAFPNLRSGPYSVVASVNGFTDARDMSVMTGDTSVKLVLGLRPSVKLRVLGANRAPVKNYRLTLLRHFPNNPGGVGRVMDFPDRTVTPGDYPAEFKGEWAVIRNVPVGEYRWQIQDNAHAKTLSPSFIVVDGGPMPEVQAELTMGAVIVGTVIDDSSKPVAGAIVTTDVNSGPIGDMGGIFDVFRTMMPEKHTKAQVTTDEQGRFRVTKLAFADYMVRVAHPAYCEGTAVGISLENAGQVFDVGVIQLARGTVVEGLVSVGGAPAGQVQVQVSTPVATAVPGQPAQSTPVEPASSPKMFFAQAVSDNDGRYRLLKRVPPGTYKITASRQSAENPFSKLLDMKDTEQTLTIVPGQERAEMNFNLQRH